MKLSLLIRLISFFVVFNNWLLATPPAPSDKTVMFDNIENRGPGDFNNTLDSDKMIGNDTLPDRNISRGDTYVFGAGEAKYTKELNKTTGKWYFKDKNGNIVESFKEGNTTVIDDDTNKSVSYSELYQKYYNEKNETKKAELEKKLTTETLKLQKSGDNSIATYNEMFLKKTNIIGSSQSVVNDMRKEPKLDSNTISKMSKGEYENYIREINASKLYKDTTQHYQSNYYSKDAISNTKYGILSNIPDIVSDIADYMKAKSAKAPTIKCQISRDLVPAYKCPLPGKNGLFFPSTVSSGSVSLTSSSSDLRLVNLKEAQEKCDKYCHTDVGELSCFNQNVLSDENITISSHPIDIYPVSSSVSFPIEKEVTLDTRMPLKNVEFEIDINSSDKNFTISDINDFLQRNPLKMKFSIDEVAVDSNRTFNIFDLSTIILNSATTKISLPVNAIGKKMKIYFYKPYFYVSMRLRTKEKELFDYLNSKGIKIVVNNIKAQYSSKDYWYCEAKQIVDYPTECHGNVKRIISGPNIKYICLDPEHRIGPEGNTGAFYSKKSCEQACVYYKPCYITYSHYTISSSSDIRNNKDILYKAKISCVDSPDNSDCTDSMCEELFKSSKLPLNEMVVQNDDTYVFTIRNGVFTNVMRPKIDLNSELSASSLDDFKNLFHKEEKDAAYMYMLKYMTYNKSYFRIGENTKMILSYFLGKPPVNAADLGSNSSLDLVVKPSAFDYSDTQEYYVYIIAKTRHHFTPIAGQWVVGSGTDRHTIRAKDSFVDLEDVNYMLKTGNNEYDWQIFRREKTAEIKIDKKEFVTLSDGTVQSKVYHLWSHLPSYYSAAFENYNPSSQTWINLASNGYAPYYKKVKFDFDQNYFVFHIADNIDDVIANVPGNLLTNQEAIDHDTDFRRKYAPYPLGDGSYSSLPLDYELFFIYSKDKLTYDDIMKKIEGDNYYDYDKKLSCTDTNYCFYEKMKANLLYHDKIPSDGLIDNNVKMFIKGKPENMVIGAEIEPSLSQKGKTAYFFVFLYNDLDTSFLDPNNVEINNTSLKSPFDKNNNLDNFKIIK